MRLVVVLGGGTAATGSGAGTTGTGAAGTGSATAGAGDETDGGTIFGLEFGNVEEPLVATFTVKPLQLFWCFWNK